MPARFARFFRWPFFSTSLFFLTCLIWPAAALAGQSGYQSNLPKGPVHISQVLVDASPAVQNQKKKYDSADVDMLKADLQKKVETALRDRGVWAANGGDTLLLTITSLTPNRPTMAQMRATPGLSMRSFGLGGAALQGELLSPSGADLGKVQYSWSETWIENVIAASTWYDARRAFSQFADYIAEEFGAADTPDS